jgi:PST family polysaccharide transporter
MIGFYDFIISAVVGLKKMKEFYSVSIKTQLINIALTFFLTYLYGVKGAMLAITINLIIGFIILISYLKKPNWFSLKKISKPFNKDVFKDYSKYFVITFSVMVLSPIFEIVARDVIIQESTKEIAGYWIAMSRIATVALVFVQTTMRRYLLPVFSSTDDSVLIKQTINKSLKMIYAFLLLISIGMCLCKELVIRLLYSKDFLVISSIYEITIAVIFIDILSWVYSVWMISKGKYIGFSSSVIIRSLIFVSGLYVFVRENALFGVVYAYSVSIFIQFIFNYAYYKFNVKK